MLFCLPVIGKNDFYIWVCMNKLYLYLRLRSVSFYRMLREIPFVYLFLLLGVAGIAVYGLMRVDVEATGRNVIISLCVFIMACSAIRIACSEKILLKSLNISLTMVSVVKYLLLSIPFFFLNLYIGLSAVAIAWVYAVIHSKITNRPSNKKMCVFYKKTSYQWLSSFRQEGVWILLIGLFCFGIALYHKNEQMLCVVFGLLLCLPSFMSYYRMVDNKKWLMIYKNASFLMRGKLIELVVNTIMLATVCLLLVAIFAPEHIVLFALLTLTFLYVNILTFYCYYSHYPSMLMSSVCNICLLSISVVLVVINPVIAFFVINAFFCVSHILAIQNLKYTLYVIPEA